MHSERRCGLMGNYRLESNIRVRRMTASVEFKDRFRARRLSTQGRVP